MTSAEEMAGRLRSLPAVDRLATALARAEIAQRRRELLDGATDEVNLLERACNRLEPSLERVLNATGVVVHTNLGRAPLADVARAAVQRVAAGYSNLEYDLSDGSRSSRQCHTSTLLRELTHAEASLVVNNCAAATLLAAAALAGSGGEIVVSRSQLIEIGGAFRIPEVIVQAGAVLVEVGTTNRTRLSDYQNAIGPNTAAIMRAHPSNFRSLGFVQEVPVEQLCGLGVPVIDDLGSGVLDDELSILAPEPHVRHSVKTGATLVCFSGDKLLGGPQAGILVGSESAIEACRTHPLARALRIDKLSLAALEATLALYRDPDMARAELPVLAMLDASPDSLMRRAERLAEITGGAVHQGIARVGGGALPLLELPGPVVALAPGHQGAEGLARALRKGKPPLIARIHRDMVLLDPRTLTDHEAEEAGRVVCEARVQR